MKINTTLFMKGGIFRMERKNKYIIERKIEAVLDYKRGKRGTRRYVRTRFLINLITAKTPKKI